jgi:hypothetical protein
MKKILLISLIAAAATAGLAADQEENTYTAHLSRIYTAVQFIQARKEGCDTAEPDTRKVNDIAYKAWRKQHQILLDELERRFFALVRRASTDQKDYSKNVGKYAGEVQEHFEYIKKAFLGQPPEQITRQCQEFPDYLKGKDADLPKRYAAELKAIRKRKL